MHDNSGPRSVYTYPVHKDIMKKYVNACTCILIYMYT